MLQYVAHLVTTGADAYGYSPTVCFDKPKDTSAMDALVVQSREKCGGYLTLRLSLPYRPRSIGPRSQNSRFWGHCTDIAEQVYPDVTPANGKQRVHDGMLRMAVPEGYPTYLDINGVETPLPSAESSVEQLSLVCRVLQRYADTHNLWLHEYIAEGPLKGRVYKSVGGRSYGNMILYAVENGMTVRILEEPAADLGVRLQEGEE